MSMHVARLLQALASRDLDRLIELMDAEVTWRGIRAASDEPPLCRNRAEVREVMANALARGIDGRPVIVAEVGDSVVVDFASTPPAPVELHQVFTFRGDRVVLMQDFPDRPSALRAIGR